MTWALHFTTPPTYFDPAETPGIITPFLFLYAMRDALVKPMPGGHYAARRFFVGSLDEAHLGQTVVAVIEGKPFAGEQELVATLRTALQPTLSRYELPRQCSLYRTSCQRRQVKKSIATPPWRA
jgi:hypothetical protein